MTAREPIPVTVLTGFLGAGKTSFLNRLVKLPDMANTAIVINEYGEVGLDHLLVEVADDNVFEMASGCLCCTIRGDLVDTLGDLIARRDEGSIKPFSRLIIETTGLADPAPVLHTIMNHPVLVERYRLEGVLTLVDAVNGAATLDAHKEAVKQAAVADALLISKTDLMASGDGAEALDRLKSRLAKINPGAPQHHLSPDDAIDPNLIKTGLYDPDTKSVDVRGWLNEHDHGHHHHHHEHAHDDEIDSFCLTTDKPMSSWNLELFMELLRGAHGPGLLRLKGIIKTEDDPDRPVVIHGVQHIFHPPFRLDAWPDDDRTTRLVFITRGIAREQIEGLVKAFTDSVRGGADAFRDDTLSLRRDL